MPIEARRELWARIGGDLKPAWLDTLDADEIGLDALPDALDRILAGGMRGRVLVDPRN